MGKPWELFIVSHKQSEGEKAGSFESVAHKDFLSPCCQPPGAAAASPDGNSRREGLLRLPGFGVGHLQGMHDLGSEAKSGFSLLSPCR